MHGLGLPARWPRRRPFLLFVISFREPAPTVLGSRAGTDHARSPTTDGHELTPGATHGTDHRQSAADRTGRALRPSLPRAHQGAVPALGGVRLRGTEDHPHRLRREAARVLYRRWLPDRVAYIRPEPTASDDVVDRTDLLSEGDPLDCAAGVPRRRRVVGADGGTFQAVHRRLAHVRAHRHDPPAALAGPRSVHSRRSARPGRYRRSTPASSAL